MAAVTVTSGYPKTQSMGSLTLYIWRLTDIADTETLATGLGTSIVSHLVSWTGNPGTQASGGGHTALSAGTITFYPSSDNLGADVWVVATNA